MIDRTLDHKIILKLIEMYGSGISTDKLIGFIADNDGMLAACENVSTRYQSNDQFFIGWFEESCLDANVDSKRLISEIETILELFKPNFKELEQYAVLGVSPDATEGEIKRAYRSLSKRFHPDTKTEEAADNPDEFVKITRAYNRIMKKTAEGSGTEAAKRSGTWRPEKKRGVSWRKKKNTIWFVSILSFILIIASLVLSVKYRDSVMMSGLQNGSEISTPANTEKAVELEHSLSNQNPAEKDSLVEEEPQDSLPAGDLGMQAERDNVQEDGLAGSTETVTKDPVEAVKKTVDTSPQPPSETVVTIVDRPAKTPAGQTGTNDSEEKETNEIAVNNASDRDELNTDLRKEVAQEGDQRVSSSLRRQAENKAGLAEVVTAENEEADFAALNRQSSFPDRYSPNPDEQSEPVVSTTKQTKIPEKEYPQKKNTVEMTSESPLEGEEESFIVNREKLEEFFKNYTSAYEQKNLLLFTSFFTSDATENGNPLPTVLDAYRKLFDRSSMIDLSISISEWALEGMIISVSGVFRLKIVYKSAPGIEGGGLIRFKLINHPAKLQISSLEYQFEQ